MDKFVQFTQQTSCAPPEFSIPGLVMDYYDGNTVTALWNYAQHFAMSDNSYGTNFGPSTPGAINVTSGNTYGALCGPSSDVYQPPRPCTESPASMDPTPGRPSQLGTGTDYGDGDPNYDICSATEDGKDAASTIQMGGQNIGDLLDRAGVTLRGIGLVRLGAGEEANAIARAGRLVLALPLAAGPGSDVQSPGGAYAESVRRSDGDHQRSPAPLAAA